MCGREWSGWDIPRIESKLGAVTHNASRQFCCCVIIVAPERRMKQMNHTGACACAMLDRARARTLLIRTEVILRVRRLANDSNSLAPSFLSLSRVSYAREKGNLVISQSQFSPSRRRSNLAEILCSPALPHDKLMHYRVVQLISSLVNINLHGGMLITRT